LTTGKIGQKGSKALTEIAANVADDILLLSSFHVLNQQKFNPEMMKFSQLQSSF
jgi:hypothetical protein